MKLELSDGMSNNSDFSNDSQNSQMSTADFMTSVGNGLLLTPTTVSGRRLSVMVHSFVDIRLSCHLSSGLDSIGRRCHVSVALLRHYVVKLLLSLSDRTYLASRVVDFGLFGGYTSEIFNLQSLSFM